MSPLGVALAHVGFVAVLDDHELEDLQHATAVERQSRDRRRRAALIKGVIDAMQLADGSSAPRVADRGVDRVDVGA